MPKGGLKDKLDGDELDLSLSDLTVVPVREIAALPKVRSIDMSCNVLTTIPRDFCSLNNLVKIDLSKNRLVELPDNIGSLQKLQHLDLYANKLTTLPIGFGYLKNLKWLDLKDNALEEPLKSIAGDCLDDTQCRACATRIVKFMKNAQSERERQRQKELQMAREEEAKKKAAEEAEKQRLRQQKKQEKEARRREYEAKRAAERQAAAADQQLDTDESDEESDVDTKPVTRTQQPNAIENMNDDTVLDPGLGGMGVFLSMLMSVVAILFGLYYYCSSHQYDHFCHDYTALVNRYVKLVVKQTQLYYNQLESAVLTVYTSILRQLEEIKKSTK